MYSSMTLQYICVDVPLHKFMCINAKNSVFPYFPCISEHLVAWECFQNLWNFLLLYNVRRLGCYCELLLLSVNISLEILKTVN